MQQVAKPRTSTAKLHDTLSKNMGREAAHVLVEYLEWEMPAIVQDSVKYLATKEDMAHVKGELKEEIAHVRGEFKEEMVHVRGDIAKTETKLSDKINNVEVQVAHVKGELKDEISKTEAKLSDRINALENKLTDRINGIDTKFTEKFSGLESQVTHLREDTAKLSNRINGLETQVVHLSGEFKEGVAELAQTVLQVQVKMEESLKVQTRWMIGAILTIVGLIVTLYMKK